MFKMKKGQLEILGFAIVVILLIISLFLYIFLKDNSQKDYIQEQCRKTINDLSLFNRRKHYSNVA